MLGRWEGYCCPFHGASWVCWWTRRSMKGGCVTGPVRLTRSGLRLFDMWPPCFASLRHAQVAAAAVPASQAECARHPASQPVDELEII